MSELYQDSLSDFAYFGDQGRASGRQLSGYWSCFVRGHPCLEEEETCQRHTQTVRIKDLTPLKILLPHLGIFPASPPPHQPSISTQIASLAQEDVGGVGFQVFIVDAFWRRDRAEGRQRRPGGRSVKRWGGG